MKEIWQKIRPNKATTVSFKTILYTAASLFLLMPWFSRMSSSSKGNFAACVLLVFLLPQLILMWYEYRKALNEKDTAK